MSNKPEEPAPAIWQDIEQASTPFLPQTAVDVEEAIQAYGDAERALYDFSDRDAIRKRDVARNELRAAIAAQLAPDATPTQPVSAAGSGQDFSELSCEEQYEIASRMASNVGYVLVEEPEHPDSPHASSAAGLEPVAWQVKQNARWTDWAVCREKPDEGYDIVEPLYATPAPALAPQDGGLRAAAQDVVDCWDATDGRVVHAIAVLRVAVAALEEKS